MQVTPHERCRFIVTSHGKQNFIDLLVYNGNGMCDCVHFASRIKPDIERAKLLRKFKPSDEFRCPHIKAARDYLLNLFIGQLLKDYPDNNDIDQ